MIRAIVTSIFVAYVGCVQADSPLPPPSLHRVSSPNGQFTVVSDPISGTKVIESSSGKQMWAMPGWFRSLYVSDDGEHLAIGSGGLNLIPLNADDSLELISFWRRGTKLKSVSLRAVVPDRSILQRTASHFAWGDIRGINKSNQLMVDRVDGRVLRFNMVTGEAVEERP